MKFKAGDRVSGLMNHEVNEGTVLGDSGNDEFIHIQWDGFHYTPYDAGPYELDFHSAKPGSLTLISSEQDEIATYHLDFSEELVNGCMDMLKDAIQIHSMIVKKGSS